MFTQAGFLPAKQGDAVRIRHLVTNLRAAGCLVGIVNLHDPTQLGGVDYVEMRRNCDYLQFYIQGVEEAPPIRGPWARIPEGFRQICERAVNDFRPDAVYAQFAYLGPCLRFGAIADRCLRILDADNNFERRRKALKRQGIRENWATVSRRGEISVWAHADILLAVEPQECHRLASMHPDKPCLLIPPAPNPLDLGPGVDDTLLFVGARNPANVAGLECFLSNSLPSIRQMRPNVQLFIVGGVCDALREGVIPNVTLLGQQASLLEYYRHCGVVLNLAPHLSGVSVKLLEAIAYGKSIVSTERALPRGFVERSIVHVHRLPGRMAISVARLLANRAFRVEDGRRCLQHAQERYSWESIYSPLIRILWRCAENRASIAQGEC